MKSIEYELTGVDGSVWPFGGIGHPTARVRIVEIDGLGGAEFTHQDVQNVNEHGVSWNSTMYDPNFITAHVRSQLFPGEVAVEVEKAFRKAIGHGKEIGKFTTRSVREDGTIGTRFQMWRKAKLLPSPDYTRTRTLGCFDYEGVMLRSDESWWRADPFVRAFTAAQFSGASVFNEGEEDVWAHYELTGPITSPTLGLAGETVSLPTIGAGQAWTIECDPDWFEIRDHLGIERSAIGRRWYKRAPAGDPDAPIPVTITGGGTSAATRLKVTLPQLFHEAA